MIKYKFYCKLTWILLLVYKKTSRAAIKLWIEIYNIIVKICLSKLFHLSLDWFWSLFGLLLTKPLSIWRQIILETNSGKISNRIHKEVRGIVHVFSRPKSFWSMRYPKHNGIFFMPKKLIICHKLWSSNPYICVT